MKEPYSSGNEPYSVEKEPRVNELSSKENDAEKREFSAKKLLRKREKLLVRKEPLPYPYSYPAEKLVVRKEVVKKDVYVLEKANEVVSKEVAQNEPNVKEVSEKEERSVLNEPAAVEAGRFAASVRYSCSSFSGRSTPNISASRLYTFSEGSKLSTLSAMWDSPQSLSQRTSPPPRK